MNTVTDADLIANLDNMSTIEIVKAVSLNGPRNYTERHLRLQTELMLDGHANGFGPEVRTAYIEILKTAPRLGITYAQLKSAELIEDMN